MKIAKYRVTLRDSTVMDIEPRPKHPGLIPLYQRAQFTARGADAHCTAFCPQ